MGGGAGDDELPEVVLPRPEADAPHQLEVAHGGPVELVEIVVVTAGG